MKLVYHPEDDILVVRLSDEPVVREISQSWNLNISFTASGEIAEVVILEARKQGVYPVITERSAA
ncbi:MAG: DUF2283 domain-containing protein [Magnetococcales bacterium]|nr:DUF2283 domain-containing protein [Magnetococcales bacterium]